MSNLGCAFLDNSWQAILSSFFYTIAAILIRDLDHDNCAAAPAGKDPYPVTGIVDPVLASTRLLELDM
jgi:hypothetical protein